MNTHGIDAIKNEAARLGWPVTNHRDLDHDCADLAQPNAPTCFGWAVRYTGTILALPGEIQDIRNCVWVHACSGAPHYYYWFDGTNLHPLDYASFIATLETTLNPDTYRNTPEYDEVLHRWQRHQDH